MFEIEFPTQLSINFKNWAGNIVWLIAAFLLAGTKNAGKIQLRTISASQGFCDGAYYSNSIGLHKHNAKTHACWLFLKSYAKRVEIILCIGTQAKRTTLAMAPSATMTTTPNTTMHLATIAKTIAAIPSNCREKKLPAPMPRSFGSGRDFARLSGLTRDDCNGTFPHGGATRDSNQGGKCVGDHS